MTSPRIVVLMSAYNEADYLGETIPALRAQTMPDWKAIILDNGSTDASWEILQRHPDPRITTIRSSKNLRPPEVANFVTGLGIDVYRDCRWFLTHGADDLMAPDYLETVLDTAAAHPNANLIFSPWQWIAHPEKGIKRFPAFDPETCHAVHQIPAWAAFTRELWAASGGHDEAVPIASDWDWVVRSRHLLRPVQLAEPAIALRVRSGERKSQSDEVHWPTLHRHLCLIAGKPVPTWAK